MKLPNLLLYNSLGSLHDNKTLQSIYDSDIFLLEKMFRASICLESKSNGQDACLEQARCLFYAYHSHPVEEGGGSNH